MLNNKLWKNHECFYSSLQRCFRQRIRYSQLSPVKKRERKYSLQSLDREVKGRTSQNHNVPRMELTAATLAVKISKVLHRELEFDFDEMFWTDSQVVLCYLKNEKKRFKVFVANRISTILNHSSSDQWQYVSSSENPANDASQGMNITQFIRNERWFNAPLFLYKDEELWPKQSPTTIYDQELEVKKVKVATTKLQVESLLKHLLHTSSRWYQLRRIVATMLRWRFKKKITIDQILDAEYRIIRLVQRVHFESEIGELKKESIVRLQKLDPFIDNRQLIRVRGRLRKSNLDQEVTHPIILPKGEVAVMIIRMCHQRVAHGGRGYTINEIRKNGFWIINCNSLVRHIISQCTICRELKGTTAQQEMADLPSDRLEESPSFTNCGVDMFGPFVLKEGRKELKKYDLSIR